MIRLCKRVVLGVIQAPLKGVMSPLIDKKINK